MTTEEQIAYLNAQLKQVLAELSRTQEELRGVLQIFKLNKRDRVIAA